MNRRSTHRRRKPRLTRQPASRRDAPKSLARRHLLVGAATAIASLALPNVLASQTGFEDWVARLRPRANARGISDATYNRVMGNLKPDTSVYALFDNQDEVKEALWQYLNRRVSDIRIITGKQKAKENAALLTRIEKDYGVDRYLIL